MFDSFEFTKYAAAVLSALLVIVSIDHPFAGAVRVEPHALHDVVVDLTHRQGR